MMETIDQLHIESGFKGSMKKSLVVFLCLFLLMCSVPVANAASKDTNLQGKYSLSAGEQFVTVVKTDGTVWGWGANYYGQLGNDDIKKSNKPIQIKGLTGFKKVSNWNSVALALKEDGTVYTWGDRQPITKVDIPKAKDISTRNYKSVAILKDGTAMMWGWEDGKELNPKEVPEVVDAVSVSGGNNHAMYIKKDSFVWGWGSNYDGQLGNPRIPYNIPATFAVPTDFPPDIVKLDTSDMITFALRNDGSVWVTGSGQGGKNGLTYSTRIPIKMESLSKILDISCNYNHCLAVGKDGTVYSWGTNAFGQLGRETKETFNLIPVKVKGLSDVISVHTGVYTSYAVKKDGTVWAWGENRQAQLGLGTDAEKVTKPTMIKGFNVIGNSIQLEVTPADESIEMKKGTKLQIKVMAAAEGKKKKDVTKEVKWSSSNTKIVKVTSGKLEAKGAGTATITGVYSGITFTKTFNVK